MMRREIGYLLAGAGAFLVVMAIVLPAYIAPRVIKWPLNQYLATTLEASNASYFSAGKLREVSGVTIDANYTFKGDAAKGTSTTAVWNEFNYVRDATSNAAIQISSRTFAFDRKSAELVNCCGASVNGDARIKQTGIAGYAFPIGTQKQAYRVFDATAGKPEPFVYSGTATVHGIQTYVFEENVGPTPAIGEPVPANYQNHVVYDVDPVTGIPLDITEHEVLTEQASSVTLFDANLAMTPTSVNSLVSLDNSSRNRISMVRTILPLGSGILGVVLLVAGVLLTRRALRGRNDPTASTTKLAAVSTEPVQPSASDARAQDASAEPPAGDREA